MAFKIFLKDDESVTRPKKTITAIYSILHLFFQQYIVINRLTSDFLRKYQKDHANPIALNTDKIYI